MTSDEIRAAGFAACNAILDFRLALSEANPRLNPAQKRVERWGIEGERETIRRNLGPRITA